MDEPRVVCITTQTISPWVVLNERCVAFKPGKRNEFYHSLALDDYVTILAVSNEGTIPLVRQYRPAVEGFTLELPGGIRDRSEEPMQTATRELYEETGYIADEPLITLGCLSTDTGRLENSLWGYYAEGVNFDKNWVGEDGIEVEMFTISQLKNAIINGEFNHSLHISLIAIAVIKGLIRF
jgi:8-oxo-dGTP pyrophosphatase MutT (NUDIX family)